MTPHFAPDDLRARKYDVFVSYKRDDDAARAVLCDALEARGYEVFWDTKLGVDYWRPELRERIGRCKLVIALWSAKAAQSDEVKDEASGAKQLQKLMSVPIEHKSVVPAPYRDTNLHVFHDWADEKARGPQLAKILAKVEQEIGKPAKTEPITVTSAIRVEFGDIPGAPDKLIGRDAELEMLRGALGTVSRRESSTPSSSMRSAARANQRCCAPSRTSCWPKAAAGRAASMAGRPIPKARASRSAPTQTGSSPRRLAISAGRASCRRTRLRGRA